MTAAPVTPAPLPASRRLAALVLGPALAVALAGSLACGGQRPPRTGAPPAPREVAILAVNDVYRIEGVDGGARGGLDRLRTLRRQLEERHPDLLVLHAGDLLFPSLLSRQYDGAQMIDVLDLLDGRDEVFDERLFIVFGNHEFDRGNLEHAAGLDDRVAESHFTWLDTNLEWVTDADGRPLVEGPNLVDDVLIEAGGVRVGIFGLTTDLAKPKYVAAFADPVATARAATASLRRRGAELVVALTHLPVDVDARLLATLGAAGPDLVVGGHEHDRLEREVGGRFVVKADADARTAVVLRVRPRPDGPPAVVIERPALDAEIAPDPAVRARIEEWIERHDAEACADEFNLPPGCLDQVYGRTSVPLVAEELEIRRCETNFGSWIADQALAAVAPAGGQVAFLNSGSLRLNQDLAAGTELTLRHVGETFAYLSPLRLLRIRGETLAAVAENALVEWPGNGRFLQVAGFAFRADPKTGRVTDLTLVGADGVRPILPDEELLAVTSNFLHEGGDDYAMLVGAESVAYPGDAIELRDLVVAGIQAAEPAGIAPRVEGRICLPGCDSEGEVGCLAVPGGAGSR